MEGGPTVTDAESYTPASNREPINSDISILQQTGNIKSSTDIPEKIYHVNENGTNFDIKSKLNLSEEEKQKLYALATKDFEVGLKKTNLFRVTNSKLIHYREEPNKNNLRNNCDDSEIEDFRKDLFKETAINPIAKQRDIIYSRPSARKFSVSLEGNCVSASSVLSKTKTDTSSRIDVPEFLRKHLKAPTLDDNKRNNLRGNEPSELLKVFAQRSRKSMNKEVSITTTTTTGHSTNVVIS